MNIEHALRTLEEADKAAQARLANVPVGVKLFGKRADGGLSFDKVVAGLSEDEVVSRCVTDMNFFAKFMLPEQFTYDFPPALVAVWNLMVQSVAALQDYRGEANLALGIPRGFAKSTLAKLFCAYCLLFTRHTFILVVGNSNSNADKIVKDIAELLGSQQVRMYFGAYDVHMDVDRQDEKIFKLCGKTCILKSKGAMTSLRGINVAHRRPDFILMDDVQDEENAKSPIESANLLNWVVHTLLPTRSPEGCISVFLGNTYSHEGSILNKLVADSEWVSLVLGALLEDGTSLWEELHPRERLLSSYRSAVRMNEEAGWLAQFMNVLDVSRNNSYDGVAVANHYKMFEEQHPQYEDSVEAEYLILDPASTKKQADEHALAHVQIVEDRILVRKIIHKQMTPAEAITIALNYMFSKGVWVLFVEDVAYQDTLLYWFKRTLETLKLPPRVANGISVLPITPDRSSKNSRILHMFGQLSSGYILLHPDCQQDVKSEAVSFDRLRADNKDNVLDVVHYAPKPWLAMPHTLITSYRAAMFDKTLMSMPTLPLPDSRFPL